MKFIPIYYTEIIEIQVPPRNNSPPASCWANYPILLAIDISVAKILGLTDPVWGVTSPFRGYNLIVRSFIGVLTPVKIACRGPPCMFLESKTFSGMGMSKTILSYKETSECMCL